MSSDILNTAQSNYMQAQSTVNQTNLGLLNEELNLSLAESRQGENQQDSSAVTAVRDSKTKIASLQGQLVGHLSNAADAKAQVATAQVAVTNEDAAKTEEEEKAQREIENKENKEDEATRMKKDEEKSINNKDPKASQILDKDIRSGTDEVMFATLRPTQAREQQDAIMNQIAALQNPEMAAERGLPIASPAPNTRNLSTTSTNDSTDTKGIKAASGAGATDT